VNAIAPFAFGLTAVGITVGGAGVIGKNVLFSWAP
jgi:hypothetical protein